MAGDPYICSSAMQLVKEARAVGYRLDLLVAHKRWLMVADELHPFQIPECASSGYAVLRLWAAYEIEQQGVSTIGHTASGPAPVGVRAGPCGGTQLLIGKQLAGG